MRIAARSGPMDPTTRAAYDASRNLASKPFRAACYAPFTSLLLNTLGDVVACCRSQSYVLGNVARESLDSIWNGPRIRAMRKAMLDYQLGPGCEFCEWTIQAGDHGGTVARHFDWLTVDSETPAYPTQIEFALGNECNFACVQCCGNWSSRIRLQREGMPPLAKVYDERFFSDLRRYLPHLRHAKFLGGEPFLAPEIRRVWDMLFEQELRPSSYIITNGSVWNDRVEQVLERLEPSLCVSLDAIADRDLLERIRVGAKYDVVTENIRRFRDWSRAKGKRLMISFSLMRLNWTELGPMLLFCEENDIDIDVIRVGDPSHLSLFTLPAPELLEIVTALEQQAVSVRNRLPRLAPTWDDAVQGLRENVKGTHRAQFQHVEDATKRLARDAMTATREAFGRDDWQATIELGASVSKLHKDYLHALCLVAHAHRRRGELDAAERVLEQAVGLTRRHASIFVERAWLRIAQHRYREALPEARQALAVSGPDEHGRQHRGYALHALAHANAHLRDAAATAQAADEWCAVAGGEEASRLRDSYLRMARDGAGSVAT
jgi:MoaA/NifB/PqqE/SkfB family radical SAM enzyme